ncbi:DUF4347 domain-containing protein [Thiorhodovibrio frisius]|uniref:DUF4347 domain-containing protein n=1 Tax=Thiorhodovibrio frisius TaxID=631362 RepID=H8YWY4_9GAMM|nr:DUF4347 domain-containing protein [Thiorhodovibrio frisius]EIC22960.1 hypothetical protein Thi970DRAFT_00603 [Thiorhodovibrio frisius]WPL22778.1 hypothetical protein Thiofri_02950 [Thiorhodovibrio frisius]
MTNHIVFIDSAVANPHTLIASLPAQSQWFLLNSEQDGLEQMRAILADYSNLASIQILSHGAPGTLTLGASTLDQASLAAQAEVLADIGASLSDQGDLLLYGCNVAQGEPGQTFITELAQLTGADVAASDDLTGAAALGGDWVLERHTGAIATSPLSPDYQGVLINDVSSNNLLFFGHTMGEWHNASAFAAIKDDGSVVTWGDYDGGGNSRAVAGALDGTIDVKQVFSTSDAFAALRADGSVVTWGQGPAGGDSSAVASELDGTIDVKQVFSTGGGLCRPARRWLGGDLGR